jgi:hypothetical protein
MIPLIFKKLQYAALGLLHLPALVLLRLNSNGLRSTDWCHSYDTEISKCRLRHFIGRSQCSSRQHPTSLHSLLTSTTVDFPRLCQSNPLCIWTISYPPRISIAWAKRRVRQPFSCRPPSSSRANHSHIPFPFRSNPKVIPCSCDIFNVAIFGNGVPQMGRGHQHFP